MPENVDDNVIPLFKFPEDNEQRYRDLQQSLRRDIALVCEVIPSNEEINDIAREIFRYLTYKTTGDEKNARNFKKELKEKYPKFAEYFEQKLQ